MHSIRVCIFLKSLIEMLIKYSQSSHELAITLQRSVFQSRVNLFPMEHLEMLGDILVCHNN